MKRDSQKNKDLEKKEAHGIKGPITITPITITDLEY